MRAGQLQHRIEIQRPVSTQDPESGAVETTWELWKRAWAKIENLSVRDSIAAQAVQSEVTARIVIRHLDGMLPTMRIIHRGKIYSIRGVFPDNKSGLEYLTLPVSEGVRDE